jgi:hypothetical protein
MLNKSIPSFGSHKESKDFQKIFFNAFVEGSPISSGNLQEVSEVRFSDYVGQLLKDLIKFYRKESQPLEWLEGLYHRYKSTYSVSDRWYVYYLFMFELQNLGLYEEAWEEWKSLQNEEGETWGTRRWSYRNCWEVYDFEVPLKRNLVDGEIIFRIANIRNQLTGFGYRNLNEIKKEIDTIITEGYPEGFFKPFIRNNYREKVRPEYHEFEYYRQFFDNGLGGEKTWSRFITEVDKGQKHSHLVKKDGTATKELVRVAICEHAGTLLRDSENQYRRKIGARAVGEEWISETELYYKLKEYFTGIVIKHHGKPKWLGRQHVDIWIEEHSIGIEYQGGQHDYPIEYFGGSESFNKVVENDRKKKELFLANGAHLIEVRPGYNLNELITEVELLITNRSY